MTQNRRGSHRGSGLGILWGALLGLGAPMGCLVVRLIALQSLLPRVLWTDIQDHHFFYGYVLISTPLVFAAFGYYLGRLKDRVEEQNFQLARLNVILERQSMIDEVTGLMNRRHLDLEIDREIERAKRYQHPMAGLMMDIDDFKSVNDRYGHLAGDLVLAQVASVLRQSLRRSDIAGRYGGDEFLIVLPETKADSARFVAARIQKKIRACKIETSPALHPHISTTISIGLFAFEDCEQLDRKIFIERVDLALLKAKQGGKDRIVSG